MTAGVFVCIVGPSGVGKDTLISKAREKLACDPAYLFVRRLVTRPSGSHEDHFRLSETEFQAGQTSGSFALAWRAHGLGYAVPISVRAAVEAGSAAVCNISRGSIGDAREAFPRIAIVLITAPPPILAERLLQRGRESSSEIQVRMEREATLAGVAADFTIVNNGAPADGGDQLVRILAHLRAIAADQGSMGTKVSPPHRKRAAT